MKKVIPHRVHTTTEHNRHALTKAASVIFWLAVWAAAARIIDRELFLPGPLSVMAALSKLVSAGSYWLAISNSMLNIISGYLLAILIGLFLAVISYRVSAVCYFISLPLRIIRTIPVASFIILALLWISSRRLALLISFLMVIPIVYENVLEGLNNTDPELLEMAYIAKMPFMKKISKYKRNIS